MRYLLIIIITLFMNSDLLAQEVRKCGTREIETSTQEPTLDFTMKYYFTIEGDKLSSVSKKGDVYKSWTFGEVYTQGTNSYFWQFISEDLIVLTEKDTFTQKFTITKYLLKSKKRKK